MELNLKPESECRYDAVSLGEVMLRLDPGEGRIRCAREFRVWEGGGEYNVMRGLRRCFGMKTGVITAFADNEVGKLMFEKRIKRVFVTRRGSLSGVISRSAFIRLLFSDEKKKKK